MDEIKRIPLLEFDNIAAQHPFQRALLVKDYYLTVILYLMKDIQGMYFKGGTALNKLFLNHKRLSEDLDFTITRSEKEVREEIQRVLHASGFFKTIEEGRPREQFSRTIITYQSDLGEGRIFVDINQRATIILPTEKHALLHFYQPFIPGFSVTMLAKEELIAEKLRATIDRNKPRDHFDVYNLLHESIPINIELVKKKCKDAGVEFSIIKMFNKAKTLKNRWDKDMAPLLAEPVSFQEVIKFLAHHFKLKEEKEKLKKGSAPSVTFV